MFQILQDNTGKPVTSGGREIAMVAQRGTGVMEAIISDSTPISGLGTVSTTGSSFTGADPFPGVLSFNYTNPTAANQTLMLFDSFDANAVTRGLVVVVPNTNYGNNAVVKNFFQTPFLFKGFNFSESNNAQLSQALNYGCAVPSDSFTKQLIPTANSRNTANNPLLLTFEGQILLTGTRGIFTTVLPGQSVTFDFYPEAQFQGMVQK
jgi:hypothetical protein